MQARMVKNAKKMLEFKLFYRIFFFDKSLEVVPKNNFYLYKKKNFYCKPKHQSSKHNTILNKTTWMIFY